MAKLYEIHQDLQALLERGWDEECVDKETGEIDFLKAKKRLDALTLAWDTKLEHIGCYIKDLQGDAIKLKAEEQTLKQRRQQLEKKAENLKNYLDCWLREHQQESFESPRCKLSYRNSTALKITDEAKLRRQLEAEDRFLRWKEPDLDKAGLKKALQDDETIAGCELESRKLLQIK